MSKRDAQGCLLMLWVVAVSLLALAIAIAYLQTRRMSLPAGLVLAAMWMVVALAPAVLVAKEEDR